MGIVVSGGHRELGQLSKELLLVCCPDSSKLKTDLKEIMRQWCFLPVLLHERCLECLLDCEMAVEEGGRVLAAFVKEPGGREFVACSLAPVGDDVGLGHRREYMPEGKMRREEAALVQVPLLLSLHGCDARGRISTVVPSEKATPTAPI